MLAGRRPTPGQAWALSSLAKSTSLSSSFVTGMQRLRDAGQRVVHKRLPKEMKLALV